MPVSVWLKSSSDSRSWRAREIIFRAERQLLQDRIKGTSGILHENAIKLG